MKPPMLKDWQTKLAQRFTQLCEYNPEMQSFDDCYTDVEDFITNIFTQLEREVEGMKIKRLDSPRSFGDGEIVNVAPGYNQSVQDIINLIKKYRGEK